MFSTAYEICKLVKKLSKGNTRLYQIRNSTKNKSKGIHILRPTRWTAYDGVFAAFIDNYTKLMDLWEWSLQATSDTELFQLLFSYSPGKIILKQTDNLSKISPKTSISAAQGREIAHLAKKRCQKDRCDEHFELFWLNLMNKKAELDVADLKLPLYFKTFDNIVNCIKDRFNQTDY